MSDPDMRVRRLENNAYLVSSDRCSPFGHEQLEQDIRGRAAQLCRHGVASVDDIRSLPSRQGSLLGECLRAGKRQAKVTCLPKEPSQ
ncbi:hypothetical protein [Pseudoxanthomonas wuyuanensis]